MVDLVPIVADHIMDINCRGRDKQQGRDKDKGQRCPSPRFQEIPPDGIDGRPQHAKDHANAQQGGIQGSRLGIQTHGNGVKHAFENFAIAKSDDLKLHRCFFPFLFPYCTHDGQDAPDSYCCSAAMLPPIMTCNCFSTSWVDWMKESTVSICWKALLRRTVMRSRAMRSWFKNFSMWLSST